MLKAKTLINRTSHCALVLLMLAVQAIPMTVLWNGTASAANTGLLSPSNSGDPNEWSNGNGALSAGGGATQSNDDEDDQGYRNFGFNIPNGSTINGIEITASARQEGDSCQLQTRLSWNDGSSNTDRKTLTPAESGSFSNLTYGGASDTWGRTWSPSDFNNSNFVVEIRYNDPGSGCGNSDDIYVDHIQARVHYTEPVQPVSNPSLSQACGLDIALVLDNSQSITSAQRTQMKNALTDFTGALSGTPAQFSVTIFGNNATTTQGFTSNVTAVNAAINNLPANPTGEYTNWQAGIDAAQASFGGGTGNPNLMIFATDGDPTASTAGSNGPVDETGYTLHLPPAITEANAAKTAGTRMLALGIGSPTVSRLQAISGPSVNTGSVLTSDVITTNFSQLAAQLAAFAEETCGGTITTTKLIDHDSNPQTPPINGGAGWNFTVNGDGYPTDANGKTVAVDVGTGTYSVKEEPLKDGYELIGGSCKNEAGVSKGQFNSNTQSVEGIEVGNSDIVSCEFINRPTIGTLIVNKVVVGGPSENNPEHFSFKVNDGSPIAFEADGSNSVAVGKGDYSVTEANTPSNYTPSYSDDCEGEIKGGQTKTCTITNTFVPAPKLDVIKYATNDNGGTIPAKNFSLFLNGDPLGTPSSYNDTVPGLSSASYTNIELEDGTNYTVSETILAGYTNTYTTCYDITNGLDNAPVVGQPFTAQSGKHYKCKVGNDDIAPQIIIEKIVKNMWGGTKTVPNFVLYLNGNQVTSGDTNSLNIGTAIVSEEYTPGYFGIFSGDCDKNGSVNMQLLGHTYKCTITNYDKPGKLIVEKKVVNDDGGDKKAKDFRFRINNGKSIKFDGDGVNKFFVPRGKYDVREVYASGYKVSYFVDGQPVKSCKDIYVENGETRKCKIVNNDIAPKITLEKQIAPEERYGDDQPSDWTLTATPVSGQATVIEGNGDPGSQDGIYKEEAKAGVWYKLSEYGPDGYLEGAWTCEGKKGTYYLWGSKLKLKPGAKVKCEVVNTEIAPKLTVKKHVVNDNGGKATIDDFGLTINGTPLTFDSGVYDAASKTTTYTAVLNVYADQDQVLSEKDLEDYSESSWACSNEATGNGLNIKVALALGEEVVCEITNDDIAVTPEQPQPENPVVPSVITLPETNGTHPALIAISLAALTVVLMSSSVFAKSLLARRQ